MAKHIPDAFNLDYPNELTMTREEGLGPAGGMMLSGARMDALIQKLGIDGSTTVVLTVPVFPEEKPAFFSMITGNVHELFAYSHHFKWWREVKLLEREWAKTRNAAGSEDEPLTGQPNTPAT